MKVYRCTQRFFCSALKIYLPVGAFLFRYETLTKISINNAPRSDMDIYNILTDGFEYDNPNDVTWFYNIEPPKTPDGQWFTYVATLPESYSGTGTQGPQGVGSGGAGYQGPIGVQGLQGSGGGGSGTQGLQGDSGVDGVQGLQGSDTGLPGPQGVAGIDGTDGTDGVQGTAGVDGVQGAAGIDGLQGAVGDGAQGVAGIDGTQGLAGIDGTQGTAGIDGTQGTAGIDGTQGLAGIDGTQGLAGIDGTQGLAGIDGTQGLAGIDGTQGLAGIDGTQGLAGIDGTQGIAGIDGTQGLAGIDGTQGLAGIDGTQGLAGIDGTQGTVGFQGVEGNQGAQGVVPYWTVDGTQAFLPLTDDLQDIGSPSARVRKLYVGSQSIHVGIQTLTEINGNLFVGNQSAIGMFRYQVYATSGEEVYVLASAPGITYSRTGSVGTFVIPAGIHLLSTRMRIQQAFTTAGVFTVDTGTGDAGNSGLADKWPPIAAMTREDSGANVTTTVVFNAGSHSKFDITNMGATGVTYNVRLEF